MRSSRDKLMRSTRMRAWTLTEFPGFRLQERPALGPEDLLPLRIHARETGSERRGIDLVECDAVHGHRAACRHVGFLLILPLQAHGPRELAVDDRLDVRGDTFPGGAVGHHVEPGPHVI